MTDTVKLNERIRASGLKKNYIAKMLGIAESTLSRKINNTQGFMADEIQMLCNLLGINTLEEQYAIFFAPAVAESAT